MEKKNQCCSVWSAGGPRYCRARFTHTSFGKWFHTAKIKF